MLKNYYLILGVDRESSPGQIKKAFRKIVKQSHPDITRCGADPEKFREAREAYETLTDHERRRHYDLQLAEQAQTVHVGRTPTRGRFHRSPAMPIEPLRSGVDDWIEAIMPDRALRPGRHTASHDVTLEVVLSPRESREGGLFPIAIPVRQPCRRCGPFGWLPDPFCPDCGGSGTRVSDREVGLGIPPRTEHGTAVTLHLEEIGLEGVRLHVYVRVDPMRTD